MRTYLPLVFLLLFSQDLIAQTEPYIDGRVGVNKRGIVFTSADSTMEVVMRFRMQSLETISTVSDKDLSLGQTTMALRRLRLRFGGFLLNPSLTYNIQLSFSRSDMDYSDTQFPNVIRDAVVYWNIDDDWQIGFGQTKLPGNRQRVISSSEIQLAERSIVNNAFTIDRDFGFFAWKRGNVSGVHYNLRAALSEGEGRNSIGSSQMKNNTALAAGGFAYTGRAELLPFGAFSGGGDYFEGDLFREPMPKLSVGATYSNNVKTRRTGGQLGKELHAPVTINTFLADVLLKYSGLAVYAEYAQRTTPDNPITKKEGAENSVVYVGEGYMSQVSYCLPSKWEFIGRYSKIIPEAVIAGESIGRENQQISVGVTKYLNNHRIKINSEIVHNSVKNIVATTTTNNFIARLNLELGI